MAITQAMATSFKVEILDAYHNFGTGPVRASGAADTFYMALYTATATLDATTTVYTTSNETTGTGYTAGGQAMTISQTPTSTTGAGGSGTTTAWMNFNNVVWTSTSIAAAGAMIYNFTQGNRCVAILSFGGTVTTTSGNFTVVMPTSNNAAAILRIA